MIYRICCALLCFAALALLGTEGVARDWSGTRKPKVVEKQVPVEKIVEKEVPVEKIVEKEVPVERVVEKVVFREPPLPVQWSQELLELDASAVQAKPDVPVALVWVMESHEACINCPAEWTRVSTSKTLLDNGWKFLGPKAQFKVELREAFDQEFPQWRLDLNGNEIARMRAGTPAEILSQRYRAEYDKAVHQAMSALPVKTINAGTVKREYIDMVLKFVGPKGQYAGSNLAQQMPLNEITAAIPANLSAKWTTDEKNIMHVDFTPSVSGRWGIVSLSVHGITYDGENVTILTPFSVVNPILHVE